MCNPAPCSLVISNLLIKNLKNEMVLLLIEFFNTSNPLPLPPNFPTCAEAPVGRLASAYLLH